MSTVTALRKQRGRPKAAVQKSRKERVGDIINAATRIFSEEGYAQMTLRRVAAEVDVSLSSVQHYFNSKEQLFTELTQTTIARYERSYETLLQGIPDEPIERFTAVINYLIKDAQTREVYGFFTQLWSIAHHDQNVSKQMDHFYVSHRNDLGKLLIALNPRLDERTARQRATLISAMIEGSMLHVGHNRPKHPEFEAIEELFLEQALALAQAPL
jgi:AcrR family transcriptional regulator